MNHFNKFDRYIDGRHYRLIKEGFSGAIIKDYGDYVLKIQKTTKQSIKEIHNLEKFQGILPIPVLIESEINENQTIILMSKMRGVSLSSAITEIDEFLLIDVLAEGIKLLWKKSSRVALKSCLDEKLETALSNINNKQVDILDMEENLRGEFKTPEKIYQYLMEHKPKEDLVLSHGDYCLPNVFMDHQKLSGFVDLANVNVMDQYQDIALCYRSLIHNYRSKYRKNHLLEVYFRYFFNKLGVKPDYEKIKYFLLLDELF